MHTSEDASDWISNKSTKLVSSVVLKNLLRITEIYKNNEIERILTRLYVNNRTAFWHFVDSENNYYTPSFNKKMS